MAEPILDHDIATVREFNRDYTRRIGLLAKGLLGSSYSLTEARVLYELAHRGNITAAELAGELQIDRGYLSRILKSFQPKRLLARQPSSQDGRRQHLNLTPAGARALDSLERLTRQNIHDMLAGLDEDGRRTVLQGMRAIQGAFAAALRPPHQVTTRRKKVP